MFDREHLDAMVTEGWLRSQRHPDADLWIFNYTEKTQYEGHWTPETLACRGLILDAEGNIVARPFPKFFNYGDPLVGELPDEPFTVTEKIDGSLGILYRIDGEAFIATRGSFVSEQARWATAWFQRFADPAFFSPDFTYLFEIIAAWNRIVVKYDWEGLVLLAIRDTATGAERDLPDDPRLLQAWSPRDDAGEHHAPPQRLEAVPRLPQGPAQTGLSAPQGAPQGVSEGLAGGEQGECQSDPRSAAGEGSSGDQGGQGGETLRGLRRPLPAGMYGLRPRARGEEVQRRPGEESEAVGRGGQKVRAGVRQLPSDPNARFQIVEQHDSDDVEDLLQHDRPNAEGYVVTFESGLRVKVKHAEYVRLHRIITGVNSRHIWEAMRAGDSIDSLLDGVPDEIHRWITETRTELRLRFAEEEDRDLAIFDERPGSHDRGETARYFKASGGNTGVLFRMLDGKDYADLIWKAIKPEPTTPDTVWTQEVAHA